MGQAKAGAQAVEDAKAMILQKSQQGGVQLSMDDAVAVLYLDLACHSMMGQATQLQEHLKQPEAAKALGAAVEFIQKHKARILAKASSKLVLATPADVPRLE